MKKDISITIRDKQCFSLGLIEDNVEKCIEAIGSDDVFNEYEPEEDKTSEAADIFADLDLDELFREAEVEYKTDGTLTEKDGKIKIAYRESRLTGLDDVETTLVLDGATVTLSRYGKINTHLVFENKKRHMIFLTDESGEQSNVCISTKTLKNTINKDGGDLFIDYEVEISGSKSEHNQIYVSVEQERSDV